jgi:hypothetical protein
MDDVKRNLVYNLLDEQYNINKLDNEYALLVLGCMLSSLSIFDSTQQEMVKQMIVDRLILSLSTEEITENLFSLLYDNINNMAHSINLSISAELMTDKNRESLLSILSENTELWKVYFIVKIVNNYIKDTELPINELYSDRGIGSIYFQIIEHVYKMGRKNVYTVVKKILEGFRTDYNYYINMVLNIENFFKKLNLDDTDIDYLWGYFYNEISQMDDISIKEVNKKLAECSRFNEMYTLYVRQLKSFTNLSDTRDFFKKYWDYWFKQNNGYNEAYAVKALKKYEEIYEKKISSIPEKEQLSYTEEILNMAMKMEITDTYVNILSEKIFEYIPMKNLNEDNKNIISKLYKYNREVLNKSIEGKLLLFVI